MANGYSASAAKTRPRISPSLWSAGSCAELAGIGTGSCRAKAVMPERWHTANPMRKILILMASSTSIGNVIDNPIMRQIRRDCLRYLRRGGASPSPCLSELPSCRADHSRKNGGSLMKMIHEGARRNTKTDGPAWPARDTKILCQGFAARAADSHSRAGCLPPTGSTAGSALVSPTPPRVEGSDVERLMQASRSLPPWGGVAEAEPPGEG